MSTANFDRASNAWGDAMPAWVAALAHACDDASQKRVADEIGYSPAVVNQVLSKRYAGSWAAVESAVSGAYLRATVNCPVLGELSTHICLQHQRRPYSATNPTRVRLYRACHGSCPHSRVARHRKED